MQYLLLLQLKSCPGHINKKLYVGRANIMLLFCEVEMYARELYICGAEEDRGLHLFAPF